MAAIRVRLIQEHIEVEPGGQLDIQLRVENGTVRIHAVTIQLLGLEPGWYTLSTPTVDLFPGQASDVNIALHPAWDASPGIYPVRFAVRGSSGDLDVEEPLHRSVVVRRSGIVAKLLPQVVRSRGAAQLTVRLDNSGRSDVLLQLEAHALQDACAFRFPRHRMPVLVRAGERVDIPLIVRPRARRRFGAARTFGFDVAYRATDWPMFKTEFVTGEYIAEANPFALLAAVSLAASLGVLLAGILSLATLGGPPSLVGLPTPVPLAAAALTPVPSATTLSPLDRQRLELDRIEREDLGRSAYNPPRAVRQGEQVPVSYAMSRNPDAPPSSVLVGPGLVQTQTDVPLTTKMRVELSGEGFDIVPTTPAEQIVGDVSPTIWTWMVAPTDVGTHHLALGVTMVVQIPGVPDLVKTRPRIDDVEVAFDPVYVGQKLLKENATQVFLAFVAFLGGSGFITFRRQVFALAQRVIRGTTSPQPAPPAAPKPTADDAVRPVHAHTGSDQSRRKARRLRNR